MIQRIVAVIAVPAPRTAVASEMGRYGTRNGIRDQRGNKPTAAADSSVYPGRSAQGTGGWTRINRAVRLAAAVP